jgi:hypothetical protein
MDRFSQSVQATLKHLNIQDFGIKIQRISGHGIGGFNN